MEAEHDQRSGEPPAEGGETPHDPELDVEGPNESAPGHRPDADPPPEEDDEGDRAASR
jgi:hypothetical protein